MERNSQNVTSFSVQNSTEQTSTPGDEFVEKLKEIKSRERELLIAKEELFESENVNESPSDENIEIKLKIEKPESNLLEPDPKPKEIEDKPNATVTKGWSQTFLWHT